MNSLQNLNRNVHSLLQNEVEVSVGQSSYAKVLVDIWKLGVNANLNLILRNENACQESERILKQALKFDITEVVYFLSKQLMKFYPTQGKKVETSRIQNLVLSTQELLNAETTVEFFLSDIDKEIINKLSNERVLLKLNHYINETDCLLEKNNSLNFICYAYALKLRKAQLENDQTQICFLSNKAISSLEKKPFELPHVVYLLFRFPLISIYIENQQFDKAEKLIKYLYTKLDKKSINWFAIYSSEILLNFRKLNFENVCTLLNMVKRHDNDINRERNKMYGAYVSLFTQRQFTLGKFKGELMIHDKDRQGHRVNIIIVHLLHLLKYKRYGLYIDKVEAIEKYMQRYLKSTSTKLLRSRYFLKCLLLTAHSRVNFNSIAWQRKTEKLFKKLQSTSRQQTNQLLEQEPVDFEYLYFYVKGLLK